MNDGDATPAIGDPALVTGDRQIAEVRVATPSIRPPPAPDPEGEAEERRIPLFLLCCCAILVGVITGLGAVLFRDLIGLVHNLFFLQRFSVRYDASLFTPRDPWGPLVILVPVVGGLGVTWLVSNFAPEAKGHGVPEVMDAIYYKRGVIRPAVAVVKSLASALAIGSGAAVGREGPIIQIGSALGSTLGQILPMLAGQRIVLVAAGAGAGIAATFNTPIGGVLFATELMLPEISVDTFLPVALATGTATYVGRLFFGAAPAFLVPADLMLGGAHVATFPALVLYAVLGVVVGAAAAAFVRVLHLLEDQFDRIGGRYARHAIGMGGVGVLIYALHLFAGHYYVEGVGYATIQAVLSRQITGGVFLLFLFAAKLLATSVSLGSGSSGGIFSPSLFMGTAIGAGFAAIANAADPGLGLSLPAFAMVGMGAMVGGGTGAAMTAVAMIFEMTRDYDIVLPMIIAVAVSLGTRRLLSRENMYTAKLARRGHPIPKALHANMFLVRSVTELMDRDVLVLDGATPFARFHAASGSADTQTAVLTAGGRVSGVIRVDATIGRALGRAGAENATLAELATARYVIVGPRDVAFDVISTMERNRAEAAVVVGPPPAGGADQVLGVITSDAIADAVAASIRIYPR